MAKKDKPSLEELLKHALLKDEDKPYEVPENWIWIRLDNICRKVTDGEHIKPSLSVNGIPLLTAKNILENDIDFTKVDYIDYVTANKSWERCQPEVDDVLICSRGTIGRNTIVTTHQKFCLMGTVILLKLYSQLIIPKYANFALKTDILQNYMKTLCGSTAVSALYLKDIKKTPIPLPPLPEQQRIVDRIESLFEKLDRAKELAQNALDSFENRKSAILHKAFTGELTRKWREEKGRDYNRDWVERKFCELGVLERGRSKHRPRNAPELFGGQYPFIQTGDVAKSNVYILEHQQTLSEFGLKQSKLFPKGTLCITIAANIGDVAILSYDCCFPDSVVGFIPNDETSSKFIFYYMSILKAEIDHNAPATAQKNINLKILNDITLKMPPFAEQQEIVRILDNLLENEQKAKELCDVIDKIDHMKKAILARAFRGELGTNNPEEESALELLKEVLKEKL